MFLLSSVEHILSVKRPVRIHRRGHWNRKTTTTSARYVNSWPDVISIVACQRCRNARPRWTSHYADFTSDKLCKSPPEKLEIRPCKFDSRRKFAAAFARAAAPVSPCESSNYIPRVCDRSRITGRRRRARAHEFHRFFIPVARSILDLPAVPRRETARGIPRELEGRSSPLGATVNYNWQAWYSVTLAISHARQWYYAAVENDR